jgi:pilus assembly protein CpaD
MKTTPSFRLSALPLLVLGPAIVLAGCDAKESAYYPPRTGYVTQPERVSTSLETFSHRLALTPAQARLGREQIESLNLFLARTGEANGDHIEIRTSLATRAGRHLAIAKDLRQSFIAAGYLPSRVEIMDVPGMGDEVAIHVQRYTVILPKCEQEIRDPGGIQSWGSEPVGVRALGCSNERNLGLMIADPRDLEGGRTLKASSGYREADAVLRYRQDKIKEIKKDQTSKKGDD